MSPTRLTAAEARRMRDEGDLLKRLALRDDDAYFNHDIDDDDDGDDDDAGGRRDTAATSTSYSLAPSSGEEDDRGRLPPAAAALAPLPVLVATPLSFLSPSTSRLRRLLPAILLFLAVVVLLIVGGVLVAIYHTKLLGLSAWLQQRAPLSAFYFCGFMALWVVLCLPSTFVELIGGFVFGFPVAFAALAVGKPTGCCIAFLLGRCIAADSLRDGLLKRAHGEGPDASRRARALFLAMERHPWKMTLLLRFMYLPIAVKNYGMACLPCPFHVFALCTLAASLPYTLLWAHMGASSRSLLDVLSGHGAGNPAASPQEIGVLVGGLVLAVAMAFLLRHYTLKYMRKLAEEEEDATEAEIQHEHEHEVEEEEERRHRDDSGSSSSSRLLEEGLVRGAKAAGNGDDVAAAAASVVTDGDGEGEEASLLSLSEEELLRMPLKAGRQPPPTYDSIAAEEEGKSRANGSDGSGNGKASSSSRSLPFLQWGNNGANGSRG